MPHYIRETSADRGNCRLFRPHGNLPRESHCLQSQPGPPLEPQGMRGRLIDSHVLSCTRINACRRPRTTCPVFWAASAPAGLACSGCARGLALLQGGKGCARDPARWSRPLPASETPRVVAVSARTRRELEGAKQRSVGQEAGDGRHPCCYSASLEAQGRMQEAKGAGRESERARERERRKDEGSEKRARREHEGNKNGSKKRARRKQEGGIKRASGCRPGCHGRRLSSAAGRRDAAARG
eukprot:337059-Rhodomonas_salina.1